MVNIPKDFRGQGIFTEWIESVFKAASLSGAEKIELTFLNMTNPELLKHLQSWSLKGWMIELIESEGVSPTVRLVKEIKL